MRFNLDKL